MAFLVVSGPLVPSVFAEEADIQKLEAQLTSELQKVNTKYQEIESLNQQIDSLNKEKETLAEKITTQEAKVEERKQVASKRLQQIQVSDFVSYSVLHLLNSESISDFLNRLYVFQQLFQSDEEVLKSLSEQAAELSRLKTAAEQASTDLVAKKEQLTAESQAFEGSFNDLKKLIADNKEALAKVQEQKKETSAVVSSAITAVAQLTTDKPAVASSTQQTPTTQAATAEPATTVAQTQAPATSETPTTQASAAINQSGGRTLNVQATGYSYNEPGLSPYTATGIDLRKNPTVIAVDPSVIPLGSLVEVPGYGIAIAGDTGGAIKGNIIDLHFTTVDQANQWGRRNVTIRILN